MRSRNKNRLKKLKRQISRNDRQSVVDGSIYRVKSVFKGSHAVRGTMPSSHIPKNLDAAARKLERTAARKKIPQIELKIELGTADDLDRRELDRLLALL